MLAKAFIYIIRSYQIFISPALRPSCRFVPTCSQYAIDAIGQCGPAKGLAKAVLRILKCHPFHPGGFDPVVKTR
ncbi:MAG: membrane protein insertion efficiency factor YidD [Pseudomonadota bacterium]